MLFNGRKREREKEREREREREKDGDREINDYMKRYKYGVSIDFRLRPYTAFSRLLGELDFFLAG